MQMALGLQPECGGLYGDVQRMTVVWWHLTLRDYDAQVGEAMAMTRTLNKMTYAGMQESVRIASDPELLQTTSPQI
ncbi:hypothetical protein EC847_13610 [Scandinavium goeteborgense]|uniref:Uncharacterized protein n=1 Tax=Scandinavium goeteborgense TaxID=1851514 RepID=A0A4R6DRB9_SCAGO|nr:hypothetical protein EC847_13610 [Scandinavium goeteborgense]